MLALTIISQLNPGPLQALVPDGRRSDPAAVSKSRRSANGRIYFSMTARSAHRIVFASTLPVSFPAREQRSTATRSPNLNTACISPDFNHRPAKFLPQNQRVLLQSTDHETPHIRPTNYTALHFFRVFPHSSKKHPIFHSP